MTKVGIYALVRLGSLLLPSGAPAAFGPDWMFALGLATLFFGAIGLLSAQKLEKVVGYCVIVSSGTLLTALGMPGVALTGPALFYLISSVLATGAFFMLAEMIERTRSFGANVLAISFDAFDLDDPTTPNRSDDVVGVAIPAAMAFLGLAFVSCVLLVTGLPPLSGFVAKFALLSAAVCWYRAWQALSPCLARACVSFGALAKERPPACDWPKLARCRHSCCCAWSWPLARALSLIIWMPLHLPWIAPQPISMR